MLVMNTVTVPRCYNTRSPEYRVVVMGCYMKKTGMARRLLYVEM